MKKIIFVLLYLIGFTAYSQEIPNPGFEVWQNDAGYDEPETWTTPNSTSYVFPFYVLTVTKETDAYEGSFSAKLETKEIIGIPVPGLITLGELHVDVFNNTSEITGGVPFSSRPDKINGYFKYFPQPNDSLLIAVFMLKHNNSTGNLDTIGIGAFSSAQTTNSFTAFEAAIDYYTEDIPDSMNILILSSDVTNPVVGSILYVDNLSFSNDVGNDYSSLETAGNVFPNPANDRLFFNLNAFSNNIIEIYDLSGKRLIFKKINAGISKTDLNIESLSPGVYIVSINNACQKLIKL